MLRCGIGSTLLLRQGGSRAEEHREAGPGLRRPHGTNVHGPTPALALPDKPSIAVLPFQNMSGDPEQEYFADGIVEDIITALSRFRLFVIARNSSFTYKGSRRTSGRSAANSGCATY